MAAQYEVASPVSVTAHRLINDHHTHLKGQRVEYLYLIDKPKKEKKGPKRKESPGDVKVISGLNAYLAGTTDDPFGEPFFVLLVNKRVWERFGVDDERKREALIDFFLCYMTFDEKSGAPKKRKFDVQAYRDNVARYGAWHDELEELLEAGEQYKLPLAVGTSGPSSKKAGKGGVRHLKKATPASTSR
jgi:hypothetical protein